MKDRADLWDGNDGVLGWVERQGSISGLNLVDFNFPQHLPSAGVSVSEAEEALAASVERGWEGVVAKRVDSIYQPGRRARTWIKTKNWRTQEIVIGGWRRGRGRRTGGLGSLLVGVPGPGGLRYLGRVGTGFSDRGLDALAEMLEPLETEDSPFVEELPAADRNDAVWVSPTLVGEVRFFEWTDSMHLRHPSWRGLREDKQPADVVLEIDPKA